jgi:hypothetical protein
MKKVSTKGIWVPHKTKGIPVQAQIKRHCDTHARAGEEYATVEDENDKIMYWWYFDPEVQRQFVQEMPWRARQVPPVIWDDYSKIPQNILNAVEEEDVHSESMETFAKGTQKKPPPKRTFTKSQPSYQVVTKTESNKDMLMALEDRLSKLEKVMTDVVSELASVSEAVAEMRHDQELLHGKVLEETKEVNTTMKVLCGMVENFAPKEYDCAAKTCWQDEQEITGKVKDEVIVVNSPNKKKQKKS